MVKIVLNIIMCTNFTGQTVDAETYLAQRGPEVHHKGGHKL